MNAQVPSAGAIEAKGLPGQRRLTDDQALRRQHRFVRDHGEDYRAHEVTLALLLLIYVMFYSFAEPYRHARQILLPRRYV